MKNGSVLKMLCVASIAAVVSFGCGKNPKLNLNGVRANPAGGIGAGGAGQEFVATEFEGAQPVLPPTFDNANAGADGGAAAGGAAAAGGWQDMNQPVAGDGTQDYLVNAKPWEGKVYFDYNRYELKASERPVLDKLAAHLTATPALAVVIEGHCDERGSDEYNRSLSERRALAIRDYLNTLGIDVSRMFTISYGEDRPDVPNAATEADHRLNRRGQFLIGNKK